MDGHIGSALKNGVNANEDGGAATHGKGDCQSVSTHSLVQQSVGTPAPGPLCDLRRACSDADMELKKTLRVCHSTRIAASCCQPPLTIPGSCSSGSLVCGRQTLRQRAPSWWLKPMYSGQCPGGVCQCPQIGRRRIAFEFSNDPVRDFRMTLLDHGQHISPTRPTRGTTCANRTSETNTSQRKRQRR